MVPDFDWLAARFEALYRHRADGRIQAVNQWDGGRVPRLHVMRSATDVDWRFHADLDLAMLAELEAVLRTIDPGVEPVGRPLIARIQQILASEPSANELWEGPWYRFPRNRTDRDAQAAVAITADNARLLEPLMADWLPDVGRRWPFFAAVQNGQAVAICASARMGERVHEAGVESHPDWHRQGFARMVVRAWTQAVRSLGAQPVYSTSRVNTASQALADSLGLRVSGADCHVW